LETETVNESALLPAEPSATVIWLPLAEENVREVFSVRLALEGPLIAGRSKTFQVKLWLALAPWPSLAVTEAEYVLGDPVIVPLIRPEVGLIDSPEGKPVAE
jgi:hypothetical protein